MCEETNILTDPYGYYKTGPGKLSRRAALDLLAAGGLATMLGNRQVAAADDETVRIGYLPITDATPLLVAYEKGYFAAEGLNVERPTLIRSWPALVESFASHDFNLVHLLKPIPVWMRYNNQVPVKIAAWCHTNGSALVVGGTTGINSFADCGGRQIAVPFWYSMHNIVLQMALREAGLQAVIKPQGETIAANEVNLQVLPPPEMPAAMAARKIDAYIVAEPFNALGELKAGGRVLRFTGDMWKNHPCCVGDHARRGLRYEATMVPESPQCHRQGFDLCFRQQSASSRVIVAGRRQLVTGASRGCYPGDDALRCTRIPSVWCGA